MWKRLHVLREEEGGASGGGGAAASAAAPASAPSAAAPAAASSAPAAPAASSAPAASAAPAAPAASPAPKPDGGRGDGEPAKGYWPDDWRANIAKGDEKIAQRLGRYASPEALAQALFAAQNRISSGELKPALSAKATAEELKEWRAAHGIPETPDKYDLGKDFKIEESDRPVMDALFKAAHASNQTPEQVKATAQAFMTIRQTALEAQADADRTRQVDAEEALRAEWGAEFRRDINLIHGLLDGAASKEFKDNLLAGRLADGTPIGSSPEALKLLLNLALIQNPMGVVVPGGEGDLGKGIKTELDELAKVPANKKTAAQSERQRTLIDAAMKAGLMDQNGNWKAS